MHSFHETAMYDGFFEEYGIGIVIATKIVTKSIVRPLI